MRRGSRNIVVKESRDRGVFFTKFVYFGPKGLRIRRETRRFVELL